MTSQEEVTAACTVAWDMRRKLAQRDTFRTRRVTNWTRSPL
jgi:hypothetical protein